MKINKRKVVINIFAVLLCVLISYAYNKVYNNNHPTNIQKESGDERINSGEMVNSSEVVGE